MPSHSRWTGLLGIAVGNALPLVLVWSGQLTIPDLVLVYFLELVLSYVVLCASRPDRRWPERKPGDATKTLFVMVLLALILGPVLASYALRPVTWDTTTLWVAGVALASSLLGYGASIWRRGARWREGLLGPCAWRFMLLVVALMAASAGTAYERLVAADWEPHRFGNGWALPAGELLSNVALALDLSPVIVAAGILCTYRLVSEVLYEVFDIFGDEVVAASSGATDRSR